MYVGFTNRELTVCYFDALITDKRLIEDKGKYSSIAQSVALNTTASGGRLRECEMAQRSTEARVRNGTRENVGHRKCRQSRVKQTISFGSFISVVA